MVIGTGVLLWYRNKDSSGSSVVLYYMCSGKSICPKVA